jgi:hypothetical protein
MKKLKRLLLVGTAIGLATAIWLPCVHLLFAKSAPPAPSSGLTPQARALAARHLELWTDPQFKRGELDRMRRSNAEWDFMGRTFLVWSLAEMSLREPAQQSNYLAVADQIIDETIRLESEHGIYFFLMPYAKARPYVQQPAKSIFLDGEIALMIAMRRLVEEKPAYRPQLTARVELMLERMKRSKALVAESYPDECWLFDNVLALAAIRIADQLDGTDHSAFIREWLAMARTKLIHPPTGLLVSSFTTDGEHLDGPEGSSIWMTAHALRLLDEDFARDQYNRARKELGRELMGFAWSREWPKSWKNGMDVDSGMVIPVLEVSAGGSGLAFVGARSFGDADYLGKLQTTLDFAAFPVRRQNRLQYAASNQVGDAVLLYACVLGPVWDKIQNGGKR